MSEASPTSSNLLTPELLPMNTDESRLLAAFLSQLTAIRGIGKDPEADALIQRAAADQPDALYLLVQKAMLQEQALNGAKARIAALEREVEQHRPGRSAAGGGFLGQDPWASSAPPGSTAARSAGPATAAMAPPMPGAYAPMAAPAASPWGGFLGSAAATAAGIAGGAFLFHGIESLMGHHNPGHGATDAAWNDGHAAPENVTINQYYGDDARPADEPGGHYGENVPVGYEPEWDSYDDDIDSVDA